MKINNVGGWVFYISANAKRFDEHKCGKWMYFYKDIDFIQAICKKAIESEAIQRCKHNEKEVGVACFYLECDDNEAHKKIIQFFLDNDLIRRTKTGKLYNISFKLDDQTRAGQYGENFNSEIKLDKFLNLETAEWLI